MKDESEWVQANADVVPMIFGELVSSMDQEDVAEKLVLAADLSQSSDRCKTSSSGVWGTLTTMSRLFDFISGTSLDPRMYLHMLGSDCQQLSVAGLKEREFEFILVQTYRVGRVRD